METIYTKIYQKLCKKVPNWSIENFYLISLRRDKIVSIKRITQGSTYCSVNPYELAQRIRTLKGDAYVIAHNHPGGDIRHSFGDMVAIDHFRERVVFPLVGSLIFTKDNFTVLI